MKIFALFSVALIMASSAGASDEEEDCPKAYKRFSKNHSYCQSPNPTCHIEKSIVTDTEIEAILDQHNTLRSKVAIGKESGLPPASNMLQMVWDSELATIAQKRAMQCVFEHDCSDCRRVSNFAVGQNIATEYVKNSPSTPEPNWALAIEDWYAEVKYFNQKFISPFVQPPPPPAETYGHFTQIVWAESWRIGCGYVLYTEEDIYRKLYVCNYGPAGNVDPGKMYKQGKECSNCPEGSCCGDNCSSEPNYPGLCKTPEDKAVVSMYGGTTFFHCNFLNQTDCAFSFITGENHLKMFTSLSGNYLSTVLPGNEAMSLTFSTALKPKGKEFCCVFKYRKSPLIDGDEESSELTATFKIIENNYEVKQELTSFSGPLRHQFNKFSMNLGWNLETELTISFSVPPGKPDQAFEIKEIYAYDGNCKDDPNE